MLTLRQQEPLHKFNFFKDNIYFTQQQQPQSLVTTKRSQLPIGYFRKRTVSSRQQVPQVLQ